MPEIPLLDNAAASGPTLTVTIPKYSLSPQEVDLVASCLILEAACQGEYGMRAVMSVIRNRSRGLPELFSVTVLKPKQFSAFNRLSSGHESESRVVARARRDRHWETARAIVAEAAQEAWQDPTDGATHYTRAGERTAWTRKLARTAVIGNHAFYR